MPAFTFLARSDADSSNSSDSISNPVYIAGIVVAAVIGLGIAVWLGLRAYRKRVRNRREEKMGAAFLSVKGLVREDGTSDKKGSNLRRSPTQVNGFSRDNLDASVVLPQPARLAQAQSAAEIAEAYRQSGTFPRAFSPKPFSFALDPQRTSMLEPSAPGLRNSFMSSYSQNRFSVMSGTSSFNSSITMGATRKVRQVFDPVLPDEILIKLGEQLTIVQSFDDGWCVVGREGGSLVQTAKSLFKSAPATELDVELGVVPAWCFLKPVKGLRAERPVRSTSLGITVNINAPGHTERGELHSWSNF